MQTWTLKKSPDGHALLAKLPEGNTVDFQKTLYMYRQDEEIEEKDSGEVDDKAAFIRKKRRRRSLKAKSLIRFEELPKGNPTLDFERVNMEGNVVDSSLEGVSATKYALLQVAKKNGSVDPSDMTIHVILVGDTYHFKNVVATRVEKSLEELDNEYDKQKRLQRESDKRYNRISSALNKTDAAGDDDEGISNPFGSSTGRKKAVGGSTAKKVNEFRGHMNDGGQDVDEERNFEEFNGVGLEYEQQESDDDDDAELLQGIDAEREENDVDGEDIFDEEDEDSDSSSEAAEEEEDELDQTDSKDRALQQASSELSDFLSASKAATTTSSSITVQGGVIVVDHGGKGSAEGSGEKRKESPTDLSADEEQSKKRKASAPTGVLTEELVRQTIIRMGGRVAAKNLAQELKKPIKSMGDPGKAKFREIVVKITQSEDDAVFGKVLVLKK